MEDNVVRLTESQARVIRLEERVEHIEMMIKDIKDNHLHEIRCKLDLLGNRLPNWATFLFTALTLAIGLLVRAL